MFYKPVFRFFRRPVKRLKVYIKQKVGWLGIPKIIVYRGYGNEQEFYITGRLVEDSGLTKPEEHTKIWHNVLATLKRFSSDEIPGASIKASCNGILKTTQTDEFGFFFFSFKTQDVENTPLEKDWLRIHVELLDTIVENQPQITTEELVRIIPSNQKRIIVSDIDDTILVSHSTQTLKKLRLMLFKNAFDRMPFEGVADFYHALKKGKTGNENNPFFFVSSSEWNLYDLLDDFFTHHNITKGFLMLRKLNYSIYKFWKSGGGNHEHKYEKIKDLMRFYPSQQFILIGDSGQRDPEIYKRLALEFPDRVEAIYIRIIKSKKTVNLSDFSGELLGVNTSFTEINDSYAAMEHAREKGFIA